MEKTQRYDPEAIETKWQARWAEQNLFRTQEEGDQPKFYQLEMFAYPSDATLHWGQTRNYALGDVVARYQVMRGHRVLHCTGFDAFGLNSENAAIKHQIHPGEWTMRCIGTMEEQLKRMGFSYDWEREVITCLPEYYKWTQWLFLRLHKAGLAYKKMAPVNWCPGCATALANEQVIEGRCERCDSPVTKKQLEQWFFAITKYADRLLEGHQHIDWPEDVITMQRNWIGRSEGIEFDFAVADRDDRLRVFTTRADTVFGVTYMVLAPEHPLGAELTTPEHRAEVEALQQRALAKTELDRTALEGAHDGVFTGSYAINPMNGERVPIWVAGYVLLEYGSGAIMAVPAHDQRDFEFARQYGLPVRVVIQPAGVSLDGDTMTEAYVEEGVQANSGDFNGLPSEQAKVAIMDEMENRAIGQRAVNYRLRDWLISRQRYWGAPIPIIYCDKCGTVPVADDRLPVLLPPNAPFTGREGSPLEHVPEFVNTQCPSCGGQAQRDVDTMDTFVCSSWYFLRYATGNDPDAAFKPEALARWLPVEMYIGGREHATMHLIYARFFCMALHDLGLLDFDEPFQRLFNHGLILLGGKKMSKTRGNVQSPDEIISKFGADAARAFILFIAPPDERVEWSTAGVEGIARWLGRCFRLVAAYHDQFDPDWRQHLATGQDDGTIRELRRKTHQTIRKVTEDIERFHQNTAISAMMELVNALYDFAEVDGGREFAAVERAAFSEAIEHLALLMSPFTPHLAEEIWERIGRTESLYFHPWPSHDETIARDEMVTVVVQVSGKLRDRLQVAADTPEETLRELALASERIQSHIAGRDVQKVIVIPNKLVNVVVR